MSHDKGEINSLASGEERIGVNSQQEDDDRRPREILQEEHKQIVGILSKNKTAGKIRKQMCKSGCHAQHHGGHHEWYGRHMPHRGFGFPLISIEEKVKSLEEMKEMLEKRLETVNKRLEVLKS